MPGFELFEEVVDSGASFNARDTHIIATSPVDTSASASCVLKGWEYIPNSDNTGGPEVTFGFVRPQNDGSKCIGSGALLFALVQRDGRACRQHTDISYCFGFRL